MPLPTRTSLAAIAAMAVVDGELDYVPDHSPRVVIPPPNWNPDLNPTQQLIFDDVSQYILAYGEKGCRTLDSLICTKDGVVRLGSLKPTGAGPGFTPINVDVWSSASSVAAAKAYWVESDRSAIRAVLANGAELTGSPRHPLWTCWQAPGGSHGFDWRRLDEMVTLKTAGWRFWTPLVAHPGWTHPPAMNPDLCYALGALCGDGALNFDDGCRSVGFTNCDPECIDRTNLGLATIGCRLNKITAKFQYSAGPRKPLTALLRELGLVGLSYSKRIPTKVIESGRECAAAFLRGLFDTDGTVEKAGTVSLCTTSEMLGRDVQDLLAVLGILAVRRPRKSASGNPTWTISIMGKHAAKFGSAVGFGIKRKQERIRGPKISTRCPSGWNGNFYGYPDPIRLEMRSVAFASRTGVRKHHRWTEHRSREWHDANRRLHSFGSIPQRHKVDQFCALYPGASERLKPFIEHDNWLEVESVEPTQAELADLHVPGPHSFLASGTLNHNSGKSVGAEHKMVRHCFENWDALAVVITPSIRTGRFGVIHDLETLILPAWEEGIGLEWMPSRLDPSTKDRIIKIGNRHNGWSTILQISVPYEDAIASRIKGIHPSFLFMDELTDCDGRGYFTLPAAQLNRRRHIQGPQQYIATCNPEGPSHWVYQTFFEDPVNKETGEADPAFKTYHVPFRENAHRPEMANYLQSLERAVSGDPIAFQRLIEGKWVERPTGAALFKEFYRPERHVIGDKKKGTGIRPVPGFPVYIGYDIGQVYSAATFMQWLPVGDRNIWIIFDEICHMRQKILYRNMALEILERILTWNKFVGRLPWLHITDDSATTQWRPGSGSYDAWEFEREFNRVGLKEGLPEMRMIGCPKGAGSISTRVRITQGLLHTDCLLVSDQCEWAKATLLRLESDDKDATKPKKTVEGLIHSFDSFTYPILHSDMKSGAPVHATDMTRAPVRTIFMGR